MPTQVNVTSPITLVAHGRSGTSLLHNVFSAHPDVDPVGETANLVLGIGYAVDSVEDIVPGRYDVDGQFVAYARRRAQAIRSAYVAMFPSEKPRWMQKPIGASFAMDIFGQMSSKVDFFTWYWQVMLGAFPDGKYITILRNPADVVLSSTQYWGLTEKMIWDGLGSMAKIISHVDSPISYAVHYDELINDPETQIRKLCGIVDLSFHPNMLAATKKIYVPKIGVEIANVDEERSRHERRFSREEEWGKLDLNSVTRDTLLDLKNLWARFNFELPLPKRFREHFDI
jgi:hypothetical protein